MVKWLESYKGKKHSKWKGGRIKSNGYIMVWSPDHPFARILNKSGSKYMSEHRLKMEEKVGRYLKSYEIVHHINGIRDDNRTENLVLTTSSDNIARSNSTRPITNEYRMKRSNNAYRFKRDSSGKFTK